ncbi:GAF domain-containing protein [Marivita sp. XM-24bin2]|uniref:GAF domain-containing protein n=1 Tax=unclassified Marivita TaxID=2632480 RepID=UPI000D78D445|nr:GAF domain-containing protein [Marivita sp. XM-24bin2]MCR9107508.1 GAF domain-containing protein [Paracoccaceae bacterium]PWL35099.1 MAG: histidine kinase [Marivita sp. XM-24bin2]
MEKLIETGVTRGAARMNMHKSSRAAPFPSRPLPDHEARLSDPARLSALADAQVMDTPPDEMFDRAARLATKFLGVPVGLASFVAEDRQYFKAQCGLPGGADADRETPLSHSFCQYVVAHDRPLAVSDSREHPLLSTNDAIADLGVIAYLGVPIHAPNGAPIGSFCAINDTPRVWTDSDVDVLTDLAAMIETELHLRHERDAMQTLAREMNHRVKNLFSVVGGMIALTARSTDSTADMARDLKGRLAALDLAHSMVSPALADGRFDPQGLDLHDLIDRLVQPHQMPGRAQVALDVPTLRLSGGAVTDLALVIHELATNAAKYGALSDPEGKVSIIGAQDGDTLRLNWSEAGGPTIAAAPSDKGFGSKLIEATVTRQMNGSLDTQWGEGGVSHALTLPLSVFDAEGPAASSTPG